MARRRSLVRKHPIIAVAPATGVAASCGVHAWLGTSGDPLLWIAGVVTAVVLLAWLLIRLAFGVVYVVFGLDPWDSYQSVCCVYVGKTARRPADRRIREHLYGTNSKPAKPWSDTVTTWHLETRWPWRSKKRLSAIEKASVHGRMPIYNHMYNLRNPRRISIPEQHAQRADREALGLVRG